MRLTARQVYDRLVNVDRILEMNGQIMFYLGDVDIMVQQKDVVGNIIQEWLQGWMEKRGIEYDPSENTQMPPDFFLNPDDHKRDLLEVKAFNREADPAFDIADFRAFSLEVVRMPYMLDADYLIFGYKMDGKGVVTISDLWLKKVWEITRSSKQWPINVQFKNNVIHKIRPGIWYGKRTKFPTFGNLEHFLSALEETIYKNPATHNNAQDWKRNFIDSYRKHYGITLDIPRWYDIEDQYKARTENPRPPQHTKRRTG